MGPGLLADLCDLVGSWWRSDRIRTSPHEGRLLRVAAGSVLDIQGNRVEVRSRDVVETLYGPVVRYDCEGADSHCELWVSIQPVPMILCVEGEDEWELVADEVEVWGARTES
jgi:hypothetical protein